MTSRPWDENAVAPITHSAGAIPRKQVIGVMVVVRIDEDAIPEDAVMDIRHSIEFGEAEVSLAYVLAPPLPDAPERRAAPEPSPAN